MSVVVTGSSGFLGRHLVTRLNQMGKTTIGIDVAPAPENTDAAPGTFYNTDPDDDPEDLLYEIMANNFVETIVHLAALSHLPTCQARPADAVTTNVLSTVAVLEAVRCITAERPCMIFAGSGEEYGFGVGVDGKTPLMPFNIYAGTKAAAAMLIQAYARSFSIGADIIRFANLYGPGQGADKFVPLAIGKMLRGETLKLHDNGQALRDWVYVDDAVDAILAIMDAAPKGFDQHRVTGERTTVSGVAHFIRQHLIDRGWIKDAKIELVSGGNLSEKIIMRDDCRLSIKHTRLHKGLAATIDSYTGGFA